MTACIGRVQVKLHFPDGLAGASARFLARWPGPHAPPNPRPPQAPGCCARCHGERGGSVAGPPLVHRTYRPAHHADVVFELAVRRGMRAHHWRFGDMPPNPTVTPVDIAQITRYVRELQRANGIE